MKIFIDSNNYFVKDRYLHCVIDTQNNEEEIENYYGGGIVDPDVNTGEEDGEGNVGNDNGGEVEINDDDIIINEDNIGGSSKPDPDES